MRDSMYADVYVANIKLMCSCACFTYTMRDSMYADVYVSNIELTLYICMPLVCATYTCIDRMYARVCSHAPMVKMLEVKCYHNNVYICICIYIYIYMYVCMYVCMYVYVYIRVQSYQVHVGKVIFALSVCIYAYVYTSSHI